MRTLSILVPILLAAAPAAAQAIVVPVGCHGPCRPENQPRLIQVDALRVWIALENGLATTSVTHVFRNHGADTLDAAFFLPVPADGNVYGTSVVDADRPAHDGSALLLYNEWSLPEEARWIAEGLLRDRRTPGLREYARTRLVHVSVRAVPPGGSRRVEVTYNQAIRSVDGRVVHRYPLSVGAEASPIAQVRLGISIETEAGFQELRSPSHAVDEQLGSEIAPCPPEAACGSMGVPTERIKILRVRDETNVPRRDFEVTYVPREPAADRRSASIP